MKRVYLSFITLLISFLVFAQDGPQETKLKLEISTLQYEAILGEPIYFSAKATNEGPASAKIMVNSGDVLGPCNYTEQAKEALVITAPDGKIQCSGFGLPVKVLNPGETMVVDCANPIGLVLKVPGIYQVKAELQSAGIIEGPRFVHTDGNVTTPPPAILLEGACSQQHFRN